MLRGPIRRGATVIFICKVARIADRCRMPTHAKLVFLFPVSQNLDCRVKLSENAGRSIKNAVCNCAFHITERVIFEAAAWPPLHDACTGATVVS